MCRAERWGGINALGRVEKRRVLDGREDMEVGERAYDTEEDNGLYRCVGGMQRERSEEGAHSVSTTNEWTVRERLWSQRKEKNKKRTIPPVLSNIPDRIPWDPGHSVVIRRPRTRVQIWLSGAVQLRTRGILVNFLAVQALSSLRGGHNIYSCGSLPCIAVVFGHSARPIVGLSLVHPLDLLSF